MTPKYSIIIPVYKAASVIKQCVDSILSQTYRDFELLLINDGSPDDCPMLCKQYSELDNRVKFISKKNGGPSSARNKGLEIAQGQFILFVDSDDWIDSDYLESINYYVDKYNCDLFVLGFIIENSNMSKIVQIIESDYNNDNYYCLIQNEMISRHWGNPWNKVYKLSIINNHNITFDESLNYSEDALFNFNYSKHIKSMYSVPLSKYHYRDIGNADSLSKRLVDIEEYYSILMKLIEAGLDICTNKNWISFINQYKINEIIVWFYLMPIRMLDNNVKKALNLLKGAKFKDIYYTKGVNRVIWYLLIKINSKFLMIYYMKIVEKINKYKWNH